VATCALVSSNGPWIERGRLAALHARAALALGRHAAALEALRRVPRRRVEDPAGLALAEADALLGLHRCGEAARVAARALQRGAGDAESEARLRLVRAQALGRIGRVARARDEALRAADLAGEPGTRARCDEILAALASYAGRRDEAARRLADARAVHARHDDLDGLVRVTGAEAGLHRDGGRPREALALASRRLDLARATTRLDLVALAHHERALLLVTLGRWDEARGDAEAARELFHGLGDPREFTLAGVALARIALAAGRTADARAALERARELLGAAGGEPASLGEVDLTLSDLCLAEGAAEAAQHEAGAALRAFGLARQPLGQCRARVRLAHALLVLGRGGEALRAARRAVRQAEAGPRHLRALAALTLGRALLRVDRAEARRAFARSEAWAGARHALTHLARLGRALAGHRGACEEPPEKDLSAALEALRAWGDERLVALSRADLAELTGATVFTPPPAETTGEARAGADTVVACGENDDEDVPGFPGILGRCAPMRALFRQMRRVAASDVAVFVLGETGTGKEKVARALHEHSRRRPRAFVAVNASSLSDELFEAELFGHARGAFTGAVNAREGLLAQAEGGTLFLDEVADLSPRAQAKLLRFLQEGEYRRVGESELRRADVRVVSAANRDLEACVAAGTFREDLLYRLNTVVLRLPALRERGDDVLLLARHCVRAAAARAGRAVPVLPAELARRLQAYAWPGNIRQLENEIARLVALSGEGPLRVEDLNTRVREASGAPAGDVPAGARAAQAARGEGQMPLRAAQLEFERDFVARALERHAGHRVRTAEALGITRQALLLKIQRLGLG
jgi:two-component system response regulator HydG